MDPGLNFDEKLEKDSLTACKKCYHILVRKPISNFSNTAEPIFIFSLFYPYYDRFLL